MKDPNQMTFGEFKSWLTDRLQMRNGAASDFNLRRDEAPYERPVDLWKKADEEFRHNFLRTVLDLVSEAAAEHWEPEAFNQLALLIEAGNFWEAKTPLENITYSRNLLQHKDGAQLHMLALRTLLALGWKGNKGFWLAEKERVAGRWPGIIFNGLAQNDLGAAFAQLQSLAISAEAMRQILGLFPSLARNLKVTLLELQKMSQDVISSLPNDAAEVLREWFRLRNYPLKVEVQSKSAGLGAAILNFLGPDSAPKTRSSKLGCDLLAA